MAPLEPPQPTVLLREDIDRVEQCLLEGFWPSPSTLATSRHLLEGRTPPSWRQAFPTAGLALQGWVDRLAAIIDYIPQLLQAKELQVLPAPGSFPHLLAPSLNSWLLPSPRCCTWAG